MSAANDEDKRAGLDAIQGDMAAHQRLTGAEVTAEANRELARDTFVELDAKGTLDRAIAEPTRQEQRRTERAEQKSIERISRDLDGRKYVVTRDDDQGGNPVPMSQRERDITVKAMKRLKMLLELQDEGILGAPSWRTKALAVMSLAGDQKRFAFECDKLLEESNRYFGDWRVDPDRKIMVG